MKNILLVFIPFMLLVASCADDTSKTENSKKTEETEQTEELAEQGDEISGDEQPEETDASLTPEESVAKIICDCVGEDNLALLEAAAIEIKTDKAALQNNPALMQKSMPAIQAMSRCFSQDGMQEKVAATLGYESVEAMASDESAETKGRLKEGFKTACPAIYSFMTASEE